jgi:SPP1 family predicted phage head-tail adaptor
MTRTGEFRTPIGLYKDIHPVDATSLETSTSFALLGTDWAAVEWESGRLFEAAKKQNSEIQGVIRIRYRRDINSFWRIKMGRRWIQIISVSDYKEQHRELWLNCKEALG